MKYLVLYEDFFSIFPTNHYDTLQDVNMAVCGIIKKFIEISRYFNIKEGPHGGWTTHDHFHYYTYVVKGFDTHSQSITMEVYEGIEAKLLLTTLTLNSKELKKALLSDLKIRFNIK
jgi:hypothetical protein